MKTTFIDWAALRNPVYGPDSWAVKDACMTFKDGAFYVFVSAFFEDRGQVRSHVAAVKTTDFRTYSKPLFVWDGADKDWIGLCSPNITEHDGVYYLTYNSWGNKEGCPNQLFYATSPDLETWEPGKPLAAKVTNNVRAIDAAVVFWHKRVYLVWKEDQSPELAVADRIDSESWERLGTIKGGWFENSEFIRVDNTWHLVAQVHDAPQHAAIRRMKGDGNTDADWLQWSKFDPIEVPQESFNTQSRLISPFIADWRKHDGHFYMLYSGTTENLSFAKRGNCKLGLVRSKDLQHWEAPPAS